MMDKESGKENVKSGSLKWRKTVEIGWFSVSFLYFFLLCYFSLFDFKAMAGGPRSENEKENKSVD